MTVDLHTAVCVACIVSGGRRRRPAGPLPSAPGCPLPAAACSALAAA